MDIQTNQTPYTLRRATEADLDVVTALEAVCFPPAEAAGREAFDWRLRCYASHFWVLERDGRIISFVNGPVTKERDLVDEMFASPAYCDDSVEWQIIFGVATHPYYQHQGLASLVMRRFIADAKGNGCEVVVCACKEPGIPFCARFGYIDEGLSSSTHGGVPWHQMRLTF